MNTEITAVETIEIEGKKAALLKCDTERAMQRVYTATHSLTDHFSDMTTIELFGKDRAWLVWGVDEVMGLRCGDWELHVDPQLGGLVVKKSYEIDMNEQDVDLKYEWIDVLVIVRNFFAIELTAEPKEWEI